MARIPMVTRTITTTKVNALCLNIKTAEPFNASTIVPRTYKTESILMEAVRANLETDEVKVVHIVDKEEIEALYGMTEQDFVKNAQVLPVRHAE